MKMTLEEKYDFLRDTVGISKEALDLAFGIKGYSDNTAKEILYWATGYDDFTEYLEDNFSND